MTQAARVVVAMSGGVDSSVAAALLVRHGFQVIGMMLRLWSEPGMERQNRCCTPEDMALARRVAAFLEIPFYAVDAQQVFREVVVQYFLNGYARGVTPNPCLACNRHIRWDFLLNHARSIGAQYLATGHYARLQKDEDGFYKLLKAVDHQKDQSYILHILDQEKAAQALFPLGDYTKPQVRHLAREWGLPVAERRESQDLCFLGQGDYRLFLKRHAPHTQLPGPIIMKDGKRIGTHQGLANYTIGQRKGLGVAFSEPLYVVDKESQTNTLVVGGAGDMGKCEFSLQDVHWITGKTPDPGARCQVKIRYRAREAWATIFPLDDQRMQVVLDQPARDITPGQVAVFYEGDFCLGGGIILS